MKSKTDQPSAVSVSSRFPAAHKAPNTKTTPPKAKVAGDVRRARVRNPKQPDDSHRPASEGDPVLPAVPGHLSDLQTAAAEIDREVQGVLAGPVTETIEPILRFRDCESRFESQAGNLDALARLHRWAVGRILIRVKAGLRHGQFEAWLRTHRSALGFCKSSAENYMKLAGRYESAQQFLEEDAPLRELYNRQDLEADDGPREVEAQDGGQERKPLKPSATQVLMRSLTTLQKRMRHVTESGQHLDAAQITQLKLVKIEIDRFFAVIINHQPANQ